MKRKLPLIRQSMRMSFKGCPRKVYWNTVAGVRPSGKSMALMIGTAFHYGLEIYRKSFDMREGVKAGIENLTEAMQDEFEDIQIEDETARLRAYLSGYELAYPNDKFLAWEAEIELTTRTEKGTIDAVYRNEHGEICIVDDKTRSRMTHDLAYVVALDEQLLNYRDLLIKSKRVNATSASIREMKKAGIKRTQKETASEYAQRVLDRYMNEYESHYQEAFVDFKDDMLRKFKLQKTKDNRRLNTLLKSGKSYEDWPYNYHECTGKYGNCSYLKLCNGLNDPSQMYYQPTEEGSLDDGKERTRIWGFDPKPNPTEKK